MVSFFKRKGFLMQLPYTKAFEKLLLDIKEKKAAKEKDEIYKKMNLVTAKEKMGLMMEEKERQISIHSKYYPIKEAKRWVEDIPEYTYNMIIFGLGLGYHIEEIQKKVEPEGRILVIIPEEDLDDISTYIKENSKIILDKRIQYYIYKDKLGLKHFFKKNVFWDKVNSLQFFHLPSYAQVYEEQLAIMIEALRESILGFNIDENTMVHFAKQWQRNIFKNLPYIFKSFPITLLQNQFSMVPAIVVAAGPSLNKNVDLLYDIKEKAIILCSDTALSVLLKHKISPHFVFTIDGGPLTYEKFREVDYNEVPLVYGALSYPKIIEKHKGNKIIFSNEAYIQNLFIAKNHNLSMAIGGSVATVAFSAGIYMGADPIVFIGQDLAFTGGKDHAEGTMYDKRKPNLKKKRKIQVKGNVEEYVYTDDTFKTYLDWFQDAIASDQTDRRYINATEGGAYIEGTEVMTLQSAIEKYCKTAYSISDKIQEIFTKSPVFTQEEIEHIVKEQRKAYNEFSEIKDKLRRSIDYSEKIKEMYEIGRIDEKNHRYLLKQLDRNDEWLKEQQQNFNLLDYILQKSIRESYMILYRQEQPNETPEEQGLRIMKGNIALYQGMLEAIEEMEPVLDEYFETMKKEGYIDE